jgi:hypothetical protein
MTMKKITLIALLSLNVFAADYSSMSITDMQAMRGTVPEADRTDFQSAMQSKMQTLSPEERQATSSLKQIKSGSMDGTGSQMRQGSGTGGGKMYRGGH